MESSPLVPFLSRNYISPLHKLICHPILSLSKFSLLLGLFYFSSWIAFGWNKKMRMNKPCIYIYRNYTIPCHTGEKRTAKNHRAICVASLSLCVSTVFLLTSPDLLLFSFSFLFFILSTKKKTLFLVVFLCYCCPPVFCIMRPSYKKTKNLQLQKNYIVENNKLCCWRWGGGRTKNCSCYFLPCLSASFFKLKSQHAKLVPCCPPPFLRTKTGGNQFKLVKSGAHITYKKHIYTQHSFKTTRRWRNSFI